jgi:hypothetical protein
LVEVLSKDELLQTFVEDHERLIEVAALADRRVALRPRESLAHLAGVNLMASAYLAQAYTGEPIAGLGDPQQEAGMTEAIHATLNEQAAGKPFEVLVETLRQAYMASSAILAATDENAFRPGNGVYERALGVITLCREYIDRLSRQP